MGVQNRRSKINVQNCIKMSPKYGRPKLDISWGVAGREQQGGLGWRGRRLEQYGGRPNGKGKGLSIEHQI